MLDTGHVRGNLSNISHLVETQFALFRTPMLRQSNVALSSTW
jgi:hypothetical protein